MSEAMRPDGATTDEGGPTGAPPAPRGNRWLPTTVWGWASVVLTVGLLLLIFVVLPLRVPFFSAEGPDAWVSAVTGMLSVDAIAALGLFAVIRKRERSITALVLLFPACMIALFFTLSVVGGAITGI